MIISRLFEKIFYFFIFVPFLPSLISNTYTAPYALICSSIFFFLIKNTKFPKELVILLFLFFGSLILLINGFGFNTLRILLGYFSVFSIAFGTYFICKLNKRANKEIVFYFFIIWFVVGFIQTFFYEGFLSEFVVVSKTTVDRGVTSLAPEPSYFASVLIFFMIINFINNYKINITILLTVISVVFFSRSMTGLVVLSLFFIFYFLILILKKNTFKYLILSILILFIFIINFDLFDGMRVHKLLTRFVENPINLLVSDASTNARMWHIIGTFSGSLDNYFLPNPNNNFYEYTLSLIENNKDYVHPYTVETLNNKPMSGTGQMFFNLGILSLLYFYILFRLIVKYFKSLKLAIFLTINIFILMTTAIPLTFPMFGFIYGLLIYKVNEDSNEDISLNRKFR